jgi:hypothetical protein
VCHLAFFHCGRSNSFIYELRRKHKIVIVVYKATFLDDCICSSICLRVCLNEHVLPSVPQTTFTSDRSSNLSFALDPPESLCTPRIRIQAGRTYRPVIRLHVERRIQPGKRMYLLVSQAPLIYDFTSKSICVLLCGRTASLKYCRSNDLGLQCCISHITLLTWYDFLSHRFSAAHFLMVCVSTRSSL